LFHIKKWVKKVPKLLIEREKKPLSDKINAWKYAESAKRHAFSRKNKQWFSEKINRKT